MKSDDELLDRDYPNCLGIDYRYADVFVVLSSGLTFRVSDIKMLIPLTEQNSYYCDNRKINIDASNLKTEIVFSDLTITAKVVESPLMIAKAIYDAINPIQKKGEGENNER